MTITRVLAVAVAFASVVLGLAGPARADEMMEGVYTYVQPDGLVAKWTIFPICVPTVGDLRNNLELPVACTLHVSPTPATELLGGDARLTGGLWTYTNNRKEGLTCADGSTAPVVQTFKFDANTLTGTRSVINSNACSNTVAAKIVDVPFTLRYEGPLTIPVDRYPLYCDPVGLKRCR